MDSTYLFTSTKGRISRAKWWAGEFTLFVAFSGGALIGHHTAIGQTISSLIWIVLYLPKYPLAAKRFQDRNKPGTTALYGYIPSVIAAGLLSFAPVRDDPRTVDVPIGDVVVSFYWNTNIVGTICFAILVGVALWLLIELGLRRGTPGPNRFGPDPLARTDAKLQPVPSPTA